MPLTMLCKRESGLHAVPIGRKCKCRHLCKSNFLSWTYCFLLLGITLFPLLSSPRLQAEKCLDHGCVHQPLHHNSGFSMLGPFCTIKVSALSSQRPGYEMFPCTEREQIWAEMTTHWMLEAAEEICLFQFRCSASRIAVSLTLIFRHFHIGFLSICL